MVHVVFFFAVYDVTKRATFDDLASIWLNEVEMYSTVEDAAKMVVANKVDLVSQAHQAQDCTSRNASLNQA